MVGSAQYRDDEIGWILAAVVARKKQDFIKRHFENRFGRPLNHNQIRYIKNKYGKDPRFNSPLVNIRPCTDASSASDTPDSNDPDEIVPIPTIPLPDDPPAPLYHPQSDGHIKRKRALEDDHIASSSKRQSRLQREKTSAVPGPGSLWGSPLAPSIPRWDPLDLQPATSLHPLLQPLATSQTNPRYGSMFGIDEQLMQGIGGMNWASSRNGLWSFDECSHLMSPSSYLSSAALQNHAPSPIGPSHGLIQTPASRPPQMSPGSQLHLSMAPRSCLSYATRAQFSPSMSPVNSAAHASPSMESSLTLSMNPMNPAPQSTPSLPSRESANNPIFTPNVNIANQYLSAPESQLQVTDYPISDHDWLNQSTQQLPLNHERSMILGTQMTSPGEIAGVPFRQSVFPTYFPILSHKGYPDISAHYILSSGATTCSPPQTQKLRQPLISDMASCATVQASHDARGGDSAAVTLTEGVKDVHELAWQLHDSSAEMSSLQKLVASDANHEGHGLAEIGSGTPEINGHLHALSMQEARWTTTGYSPTLSNPGPTNFPTTLGLPAHAEPFDEYVNDNFIDPGLLESFDLDRDKLGMTVDGGIVSPTS